MSTEPAVVGGLCGSAWVDNGRVGRLWRGGDEDDDGTLSRSDGINRSESPQSLGEKSKQQSIIQADGIRRSEAVMQRLGR